MIDLTQVTGVIVGRDFNISTFEQFWLIEKGIVFKEELAPGSFYTPVAVNVPARDFSLLIVPERIQLFIKPECSTSDEILERVLGGLAGNLAESQILAVGLNFQFIIGASNTELFIKNTRKLFMCLDNPLSNEFDKEDSRFGGYLSKDIFSGRLRVDIKPVRREGQEFLRLDANLHKDFTTVEELSKILGKWPEVRDYISEMATHLSSALEAEDGSS